MVALALRKALRNKWLVLSILAGLMLATALVSSVPIYTRGILQKVLISSMEDYQIARGRYPAGFHIRKDFGAANRDQALARYREYQQAIEQEIIPGIDVTWRSHSSHRVISALRAQRKGMEEGIFNASIVGFVAAEGLAEHTRIVAGKRPSPGSGETLEVLATPLALEEMGLLLDEVYVIAGIDTDPICSMQVVGLFELTDGSDEYWYPKRSALEDSLFVDPVQFDRTIAQVTTLAPLRAEWYYTIDYHTIRTPDVPQLLELFRGLVARGRDHAIFVDTPLVEIMEQYLVTESRLKRLLVLLQIPVLTVLCFFLVMVSRLFIQEEKNEIALLKSRGANTRQVFVVYLVLFGLLAFLAMLAGPLLGYLLAQLMGFATGFLQFTPQPLLPTSLSLPAYGYAAIAAGVLLAAMLPTAIRGARTTIVLHKRTAARQGRRSVWRGVYLDLLLVGVAFYGFYSYSNRRQILRLTGATGADLPFDPLFFVVNIGFILGTALVAVRLLPLLVRTVSSLTSRILPPPLYTSLIHLGRSAGTERYAALFLVLTVAVGIFDSASARTLTKSASDRVLYANGCDVRIAPFSWARHSSADILGSQATRRWILRRFPQLAEVKPGSVASRSLRPQRELPIRVFEQLPGVEAVSAVFRIEDARVRAAGGKLVDATILAVDPETFGRVAWYRNDLFAAPWRRYIELLAANPNGCFVSRNLEAGDTVGAMWGKGNDVEFMTMGTIEYWPTYNPTLGTAKNPSVLIVANFRYVQAMSTQEAYEAWIRRDASVPDQVFYRGIIDHNTRIVDLWDSGADILDEKQKPAIQGVNGTLTLGFSVVLAISVAGFLLCWIISIRGRVLQFGIMRALGMSRGQVLAAIVWEQVLVAVLALGFGMAIGNGAAGLFLPFLQINLSAAEQIPPMEIGAFLRDYATLAILIAVVLLGVMVAIGGFVSRVRVDQAIKLGED